MKRFKLNYIEIVLFILFAAGVYYVMSIPKEIECAPQQFTQAYISINSRTYTLSKADTACKVQQGIQNKLNFDYSGMIFIFPTEEKRTFWMKNTIFPLSIAFLDEEGRIVDMQDMEIEPTGRWDFMLKQYSSSQAAKYAIEVPRGWFSQESIKLGDTVEIR